MDKQRKRELLEAYKNRKPEMGLIYFKCIPTETYFIGISKDTKADINSSTLKLETSWHPNRELTNLWKEHGKDNFEVGVLEVLSYEEDKDDYSKELEDICEKQLSQFKNARRLK